MRYATAEDLATWRIAARTLIAESVHPNDVVWGGGEQGGLYPGELREQPASTDLSVPRSFMLLAEAVACYDDAEKWPLLYRILYRLQFENKDLIRVESDADIREARLMEKAVNRDVHKFHAFVRFRRIECDGEEIFAAWYEPNHWTVERATPFFERRFGAMKWSIFTPKGTAHWDLKELKFGPPANRRDAPSADEFEEFWLQYYRSIFNPFRLNVRTMKRELPVRHWPTLPEASLINDLIREAAGGSTTKQ